MLSRGQAVWGFAADDSHHHFSDRRSDGVCQAWIMVKAPRLERAALLRAIAQGHFYSSSGPVIEALEAADEAVTVRTSPVKVINFIAPGFVGKSFTAVRLPTLTKATYRLQGNERYLRVECWDSEGRGAWSNPLFAGRAAGAGSP